jgi:c-di-GMP-binding flagellar brake protein YcgR
MVAEQRKYTRFSVPDNAYAALGPTFTKVGKIKDISIGGLALEYLTDEDIGLENTQVDVFLRGEEFHISKIPCQLVYDLTLELSEGNQVSANNLMRKRCGVRFRTLTKNRRKQLEQFIATHTNGPIK